MQTTPRPLSRAALTALYASAVVIFSDMYLTQPILPQLAAEFNVTPAVSGLTVSAVVLMVALGSLLAGPLSDIRGRKPVMVGALLLLSLPTLLCALVPSFELLMLTRALQGLCIPGLTAVAVAYLSELLPAAELGRAVGGWIAANVAGGLFGRVAGGLLTDLTHWRVSFVVFAAVTLLCGLALARLLPADQAPRSNDWRQGFLDMLRHLRNPQLLAVFFVALALFFGFLGVFTFLPYYLEAPPFNLPPALIALAYSAYLAGVIVSPQAGAASARFARHRIISLGLLVAVAGILLTLIPTLPTVTVGLFVLCTGMFTAQGVAPALANRLAAVGKGAAGALYLVFYYLGGTLGAVLPGLGFEALGWPGVVLICCGALLLALIAVQAARDTA